MKITFVNHASTLLSVRDVCVWSDPWLSGLCFNDSWALLTETPREVASQALREVTHIYLSHEHPDHFHPPTLRSLPDEVKARVTVIIQNQPYKGVLNALKRFGFRNVAEMKHREFLRLGEDVDLYFYHVFPIDSAMALVDRRNAETIINLNDTELSGYDRRCIEKDLGRVQVTLNQFSIATYDGRPEVAEVTKQHRDKLIEDCAIEHQALHAEYTVPFASFAYFCQPENNHLNTHRTMTADFAAFMEGRGCKTIVLKPGDTWERGESHDNAAALAFWTNCERAEKRIFESQSVQMDALAESALICIDKINRFFTRLPLAMVATLSFALPDLSKTFVVDFRRRETRFLEGTAGDWDVRVNSQPLWFAFKHTFGMQTLSISGRFVVRSKRFRLMVFRIVTALLNSELYLSPRHFFRRDMRQYVKDNAARLFFQTASSFRIVWSFLK